MSHELRNACMHMQDMYHKIKLQNDANPAGDHYWILSFGVYKLGEKQVYQATSLHGTTKPLETVVLNNL